MAVESADLPVKVVEFTGSKIRPLFRAVEGLVEIGQEVDGLVLINTARFGVIVSGLFVVLGEPSWDNKWRLRTSSKLLVPLMISCPVDTLVARAHPYGPARAHP